jgi:hypothetical protein
LNSGPTTAGVLRGEKARFQLFGDVRYGCARVHNFSLLFNITHLYSNVLRVRYL